jgi:hypothetical protein
MAVTYDLYDLMAGAILTRRQVLCTYRQAQRHFCPVVLGHRNGAECVLTWQFAGTDEDGAPIRGSWKFLPLQEVSDVRLHDGPWNAGDEAQRPRAWFDDIELDAYTDSRDSPRRARRKR